MAQTQILKSKKSILFTLGLVLLLFSGLFYVKNYILFYYSKIFLDNLPYHRIEDCNKFFDTKEKAKIAKQQILEILNNTKDLAQKIKENYIFVTITHETKCKDRFYLEIIYNSHYEQQKIIKLLKDAGIWGKYVISFRNV